MEMLADWPGRKYENCFIEYNGDTRNTFCMFLGSWTTHGFDLKKQKHFDYMNIFLFEHSHCSGIIWSKSFLHKIQE